MTRHGGIGAPVFLAPGPINAAALVILGLWFRPTGAVIPPRVEDEPQPTGAALAPGRLASDPAHRGR